MVWLSLKPRNKLFNHKKLKTPYSRRFFYFWGMKKQVFKILAKANKLILPSMGKREVDMSKAKKWQMAIIGWRYYVTRNSLD